MTAFKSLALMALIAGAHGFAPQRVNSPRATNGKQIVSSASFLLVGFGIVEVFAPFFSRRRIDFSSHRDSVHKHRCELKIARLSLIPDGIVRHYALDTVRDILVSSVCESDRVSMVPLPHLRTKTYFESRACMIVEGDPASFTSPSSQWNAIRPPRNVSEFSAECSLLQSKLFH